MRIGLFQHYRDGLKGSNKSFPLWQGYLKSYFEHYSPTDRVEIEFVHSAEELNDTTYDIVALSSTTVDSGIVTELAYELKSLYNPTIILGGYHVSTLPHTMNSVFDYGVMGEGEQTFLEIVNALLDGKPSKQKLSQINGLIYHDNGDIVINPPRREIHPLDKVPIPERSLRYPPDCFTTSRGCQYRCAFCGNARTWNKVRYFSAGRVIEELQQIAHAFRSRDDRLYMNNITFLDDLAVADRERLKEIVSKIEITGINNEQSFTMYSRAEIVDIELVELMKRMNVISTTLGLESGTDRILKLLKSKSASVSQNQKALDILHNTGITVSSGFIIGYFDETREEIKATLDFILRNIEQGKLGAVQISVLVPIPGTTIWNKALERKLVSEDMDWNRMRHMSLNLNVYEYIDSIEDIFAARLQNRSVFLNENLSENELKDLILDFHSKYDPIIRRNAEDKVKKIENDIFNDMKRTFCSDEFRKHERVVIYGASVFTQKLIRAIPYECKGSIVGIVDRDPLKQGTFLGGKEVLAPEEILSLSPQAIIIGSLTSAYQIEKRIKEIYAGQNDLPSIIKIKK